MLLGGGAGIAGYMYIAAWWSNVLSGSYKINGGDQFAADELRKLSWSGIPPPVRNTTWQILCVSIQLYIVKCMYMQKSLYLHHYFYTLINIVIYFVISIFLQISIRQPVALSYLICCKENPPQCLLHIISLCCLDNFSHMCISCLMLKHKNSRWAG